MSKSKEGEGYNYQRISSATTTTVKSGKGYLKRIVICTPVAASTITVYDNTAGSGTIIALITNPASIALSPVFCDLDIAFTTGLTIVTSGADNLTVVWI